MNRRISRNRVLFSLATLLLVWVWGVVAVQAAVTGVCGVYPTDEGAYMAAQLDLGGQALGGLQWFNNDGQQPFEGVVLLEGRAGHAPDLSGGALVLGEVWGLSESWSELSLPTPVVSSTGLIDVVFVIPAGALKTSEGAFGGPGIGYTQGATGHASFVSSDGLDWTRVHPDYHLAVQPVLASGKAAATVLSSLDPARGQAMTKAAVTGRREQAQTALLPPKPNPFNPRTQIRYSMATAQELRIVVYDVRGRRVKTLHRGSADAGLHELTWYGRDDRGRAVASGVYYVKMETPEGVLSRPISLVR